LYSEYWTQGDHVIITLSLATRSTRAIYFFRYIFHTTNSNQFYFLLRHKMSITTEENVGRLEHTVQLMALSGKVGGLRDTDTPRAGLEAGGTWKRSAASAGQKPHGVAPFTTAQHQQPFFLLTHFNKPQHTSSSPYEAHH
jgi:hypothetical protein